MTELRNAVAARRSQSKVTQDAPTHEQILELVASAARVADHGGLRPWRLIELRGDARIRLGRAMADAEGEREASTKPLRAALLIAIVFSPQPSEKVDDWEQEAVASGVAHLLSLLLDDAGWGVMWRTGRTVRTPEVAAVHGLTGSEQLLGWLYVGGKLPAKRDGASRPIDVTGSMSVLT